MLDINLDSELKFKGHVNFMCKKTNLLNLEIWEQTQTNSIWNLPSNMDVPQQRIQ